MKLKNLWAALLTLAVVFMLASCDKEDGNGNGNGASDTIVGRWTLYLEEASFTDTQGIQERYTETYEPGEIVFEFQADGTGIYSGGPDSDSCTWTLKDDQLTLDFEGDLATYTVSELGEQLVLEYTENDAIGDFFVRRTFNRY